MSYFEALEQATSGNLSDEVLNAMRRESRRGSGTSEQLQVKVNLGVALLQAGNRATKPADYNSLYQESEEIFLSVLAVDSGNEFAQENLAVVRKNRNIRKKELQGDHTEKHVQQERQKEKKPVATALPASYAASTATAQTGMSYAEAINLAAHGHVFRGAINVMRNELLKAERDGLVEHALGVKVNLGVALLQMGNRVFCPAYYMPMYRESEELFESALRTHPANELVHSNLAAVRGNRDMRPVTDPAGNFRPPPPPPEAPFLPAHPSRSTLGSEGGALGSVPPSCAAVAVGCAGAGQTRRWLTIGIPTVPRRGNADYLAQTVDAIAKQLPTHPADPLFGQVAVVVLNNRPGGHAVFDAVRRRIAAGPHAAQFHFEEADVLDDDGVGGPEGHVCIPTARESPLFRRNPLFAMQKPPISVGFQNPDSSSLRKF